MTTQSTKQARTRKRRGFSLIELMVSMAILSGLLVMFVGLLDQTQRSWDYAQGQISQFREARVAFDIMTKNLSQATLNTYWEQVFEDDDAIPDGYQTTSELHFVITDSSKVRYSGVADGHALFFQAPLGVTGDRTYENLSNLLCGRGYFVAFGDDTDFRPPFVNQVGVPTRWRYRLMEYIPPTEYNSIFVDYVEDFPRTPGQKEDDFFGSWYSDPADLARYTRPLADNIVAITFSPREPYSTETRAVRDIAPRYEYDSEWPGSTLDPASIASRYKHRLPPLVKVTMVAIDETTAIRFEDSGSKTSPYMDDYVGSRFRIADRADDDIEDLLEEFDQENEESNGINIRYKVFSSTVGILSAKWGSSQ